MNIILTVGLLLIIVSYATRKSKYAPLIGFAFVFLIMGFQSGVEGDYMNYKDSQAKIAELNEVISARNYKTAVQAKCLV